MKKNAVFAVLAAVSLLCGACGARLSKSQIEALNQQSVAGVGSGSSGASGSGSSQTGGSGNSTSGTGVAAGGATGSGSGGGSASGGGGASSGGSGGAVASGGGSSGGGAALAAGGKVCPGGGTSHDPGVSASEIDVGNVSTLTGPVPGLFLGAQRGTQAFASYINSVGGVCGRKLVVKSADDNLDASQNATATQSLANQVLAFVGSFSVDDQGGAAVLQQDGIPDIGFALSPQRFNLPNNFSPQPEPVGWNIAPYIYFKQKYPDAAAHMAYFTENNATAEQTGLAEVQALKSIGYQFVYSEEGIEPTQTNFDTEARNMQSHGVKGIVFQATASVYADMAKSLYNVGYLNQIQLADWGAPAYDPSFVAQAGPAANGAILEQSLALYAGEDAGSIPEVALFDKWYTALYHSAPDIYATYGWLSGMLFVQGINAGGAPTRSALQSGLSTITQFTGGGIVATDNPAKKTPAYCYIIIDVVNGKFVRDPADPKTGFDCANTPNYYLTNA
ncbi:MAG TPA: ABC transporter substrate-binding protein [Acidimicrobiales bacterium]|nr:ABC transporter substrate-binding protein [Acidimicrobiales bacterium]